MPQIKIEIPEFITHVAKTDNKVAANKMIKINHQSIYNGALNRFSRAIAINNMHNYISKYIDPSMAVSINNRCNISYEFHTVMNHGNISMRKGIICWKPVKGAYKPEWDIENLAGIWVKAGNDTLTAMGVLADDNVAAVKKVSYEHFIVQDVTERKIVIIIDY